MTGSHPVGPELAVPCDQFINSLASLFSGLLSSSDSEDSNPFDQLLAFKELFNRIDSDHDGRLFPDQLHELVRGLTRLESNSVSRSPDVASTEMIVNHLDKTKKGFVDYSDFLAGALLSTDPSPSAPQSVENNLLDDADFMTAVGPPSQHETVFDDQLELDFKPSPARSSGNAADAALLHQLKTQQHLLEQRLSAVQSELEKSEASRADLLARLSDQDKQIDGYKKQAKAIAEMEQDRVRASDEMENLRAELHASKESLKNAQKLEAELSSERDRLRDDLFHKGRELNDLEDQLRTHKDVVAGSEDNKALLESLQAELEAEKRRYAALVATKDEQDQAHAKLMTAFSELQSKHELTLLEFDDAKRRFDDLTEEKMASVASPSRPKGSNLKAELSTSLKSQTPQKYTSTTDFSGPAPTDAGSEDVAQLRVELDMLNKEKKTIMAHLSSADARTTALEREKLELSAKIATLAGDLTAAERTKIALQKEFAETKAELEESKGMLTAAQDAVTAANAAAAKAAASAFSRPEMSITEAELEELRVLRLSRRELEEHVAKQKHQIDGDSMQLKAVRSEIQQLRDANRNLKARLAQMPEEQVPLAGSSEEDMRRGLIGNNRVDRHDQGCCSCSVM